MADSGVLRVQVLRERCQGHNRCCSLAPELFEADELGNARAIGDGVVPLALRTKAELAVKNCPEHAVRLATE